MSFLEQVHAAVAEASETLTSKVAAIKVSSAAEPTEAAVSENRFGSFAPQRENNDAKWYVDGASYMYAVSQALERARETVWILDWWLSPELYLRRPPSENENYRLDRMLLAAANRGVKINICVYKEVAQALTLDSLHTKHALEALHPSICVFRHPDHVMNMGTINASLQHMKLNAATASRLPLEALKAFYGAHSDTVLYWAHHEKLCLIDGHMAFMGGLDLCYGRWDTNQHSIADVHPQDLNQIIFPGQDYNDARIMDFQTVDKWQDNKLDRTKYPRMGWSDVSLCLVGYVVEDLKRHFVQRWNFIFDEKYIGSHDAQRYSRLRLPGLGELGSHHHHLGHHIEYLENEWRGKIVDNVEDRFTRFERGRGLEGSIGPVTCQIMRSCCKWSHNTSTEHSIQNAYIEVIRNSKHFVYIENQFFITATTPKQEPITNLIGAAIVERILRAARADQKFKIIVIMPAIPAFAGDLRDDAALATRAIMEFQYRSINRDKGMSIMEVIAKEGINPLSYIRFYNLRSYDRINKSEIMAKVEDNAGVSYDEARRYHDDHVGAGYGIQGEQTLPTVPGENPYRLYQKSAQGATSASERWNSVAECYMLGGEDIRNVPWDGDGTSEMDAFVSEELYVHTKLLIADDQTVICGSANLNDRSQCGNHDSEIAVCIQEPPTIQSRMNSQPWPVSKFAASLRRQIMRKHLGLLKTQDIHAPDANFSPLGVSNAYDWSSEADQAVMDPLSDEFLSMWNWQARTNTEVFEQVFHSVPTDRVTTWKQYDEYYEKYFKADERTKKSRVQQGHVITDEFQDTGVRGVKEALSRIRGTLVEMPLLFLKDEDIAKEGLSLNDFTEAVYT